ncbi:hypothetical protein D3C87_1837580 [compost metagenome]
MPDLVRRRKADCQEVGIFTFPKLLAFNGFDGHFFRKGVAPGRIGHNPESVARHAHEFVREHGLFSARQFTFPRHVVGRTLRVSIRS